MEAGMINLITIENRKINPATHAAAIVANCRGVAFFIQGQNYGLILETVTDTFNCFNVVAANFFAKFPDMHIKGAIAHIDLIAPYF